MKIYYQHPNTWFGDCMPFGKDDTFYLSLDESRSGELLFINLQSTLSSEVWWLPRDMSRQEATCFLPAQQGHEYQIDHFQQCF